MLRYRTIALAAAAHSRAHQQVSGRRSLLPGKEAHTLRPQPSSIRPSTSIVTREG
jgi:hypothetical protein